MLKEEGMAHLQLEDGKKPENTNLKIKKHQSYCRICKQPDCKKDCLKQLKKYNNIKQKIDWKIIIQLIFLKIPLLFLVIFIASKIYSLFYDFWITWIFSTVEMLLEIIYLIVWIILKYFMLNKEENPININLWSINDPISFPILAFLEFCGMLYFLLVVLAILVAIIDREIEILKNMISYLKEGANLHLFEELE